MSDDALSLLQEVHAEIVAAGVANTYQYTSGEWVKQFGRRLEAFEPFRTIAAGWIVSPTGGGRIGAGVSGLWAWHRLLLDATPQEIMASVTGTVASNCFEVREVRPIKGISVGERQHLTDAACLCPINQLQTGWHHQRALESSTCHSKFSPDTAALVQSFIVKPAIVPLSQSRDESSVIGQLREAREAFATKLRFALGLASGSAVEMPVVYCLSAQECILAEPDSLPQKPNATSFGNDVTVDVDVALRLLAQLERMGTPRALELCVDRLLRSRLSRSLEDRIVDLGMAAEIALMHAPKGSGDGKGEITNKLSARGAWLIGADVGERLRVSALLAELYAARSIVVHTGVANGKLQTRVEVFDKLVSNIATALLNRGAFPDWQALVLGGTRPV